MAKNPTERAEALLAELRTAIREYKGAVDDLAKASGISKPHIYNIAQQRHEPSASKFVKLFTVMGYEVKVTKLRKTGVDG